MAAITAVALEGLPEIRAGDDLARLIADGDAGRGPGDRRRAGAGPQGRLQGRGPDPAAVDRSARASERAASWPPSWTRTRATSRWCSTRSQRDPAGRARRADRRHPSRVRVRQRRRRCLQLARRRHGDPAAARPRPLGPRAARAPAASCSAAAPAVLITDSFGRAWRHGQCDVAIGCAGLRPLEDWRGRPDARGRELKATWIAVADELAAAADLARAKDAMQPAVLVSGAGRHVTADDGPGAEPLVRGPDQDDPASASARRDALTGRSRRVRRRSARRPRESRRRRGRSRPLIACA